MTEHREPVLLTPRRVPARAGAVTRVLLMIDDPEVGASEVAAAVGADPALAARAMALANSAYYGLSGRVGTLKYAISLLGFQTIRALAVALAAGLNEPNAVPAGYWDQAATAASAANLLAPVFGASAPDAFCAGLLHTLGSALLHQQGPPATLCLPFPGNDAEFDETERAIYGIGHAEAAAELLESWRFPDRLCALIAEHHEVTLPDASPLSRTLHAARTLTDLALRPDADASVAGVVLTRLSEGNLLGHQVDQLVGQIRAQTDSLLGGLRAA